MSRDPDSRMGWDLAWGPGAWIRDGAGAGAERSGVSKSRWMWIYTTFRRGKKTKKKLPKKREETNNKTVNYHGQFSSLSKYRLWTWRNRAARQNFGEAAHTRPSSVTLIPTRKAKKPAKKMSNGHVALELQPWVMPPTKRLTRPGGSTSAGGEDLSRLER